MNLITKSGAAVATGVAALLIAASVSAGDAAAASAPVKTGHVAAVGTAAKAGNVQDACGTAKPGRARCFARIRTDVHGGTGVRGEAAVAATGHATALPSGFGPADLHSAYHLPMTGGAGQTVALIDAGDSATAEADLAVYRSTYGLPACTTANGCFHKVNQRGAAAPAPADAGQGWGAEIAIDVDMVSASCPSCRILLVEADSQNMADLAAAVDTAVRLGATEVSNSYGVQESGDTATYAADYQHPGVAILASSGDSGYTIPSEPAVYSSVVAVGGTSLTQASNARGWSESAWNRAGSGCSAWIDKPAWQNDPNCPGRMVADVAAVGDPDTGVAAYDTLDGVPGWIVAGGTSVSSPIVAGVVALAGHPERFADASRLYAPSAAAGLNDVTTGSNSVPWNDCGGDYQCLAARGYDGPTGNGTPNGLSAF